MHTVIDENVELSANLRHMDTKVQQMSDKIGNMTLSYGRRIGDQDKKLDRLDALVHKPNNFLQLMKNETEKIDRRLTKKIQEVEKDVCEKHLIRVQETKTFEEQQAKQEEFYKLSFDGLKDLRLDFVKQNKKFEIFERVASEFQINIEALKTHALSTDLHLESALPLQIASISYEVGIGAILKK